MAIAANSLERLIESIDALVSFAQANGVEYQYEIQKDLSRTKAPLSLEKKKQFAKLDGAVVAALKECEIAAFHDLHQPIEGGFELGRSKLRCVDTDGGPAIVYSDKWLVYLQCLREEAQCMLKGGSAPHLPQCRMSVETDITSKASFVILDDIKSPIDLETAIYLEELIKTRPGAFKSAPEIARARPDFFESDPRVTRIRDRLKRNLPEVYKLIVTSNSGSRLADKAWLE
ncbi:MAG: hypothetical protein C0485_13845 [Pirellula sp.]|nr:hypothetical protein [Pirellula sp.]